MSISTTRLPLFMGINAWDCQRAFVLAYVFVHILPVVHFVALSMLGLVWLRMHVLAEARS